MKRHGSPGRKGPTGEVRHASVLDIDSTDDEGWRDMEILKIFMGADVELDPATLEATCVEIDKGSPQHQAALIKPHQGK